MTPEMPDPNEPRDAGAKTWSWKTGIGKEAVHNVLHLENQVLYCRLGLKGTDERDRLLGAVKHTHPLRSLHPADMLHVAMIHEMRLCRSIKTLEIDHGDRLPFTIRGSDICEDAFASIRKSICREYRMEDGTLSIWNAIQAPAGGMILVATLGGVLSYLMWQGENVAEMVKYVVPAITAVLFVGLLGSLVSRIVAPPKAEVLRMIDQRSPDVAG